MIRIARNIALASLATGLIVSRASANICGTDYQNFNPTTNGLDFVTVHSSETLRPCIVNMGIFGNYAANSLTYSETLNANVQQGQKRNDRIFSADLSIGIGLTDRWDIGFSVPVILDSSVKDDYYVSSFDSNGVTEIKANSKYRILGDHSGGLAAIVSVNKNMIENNPFSGRDSGLTWNFELAADRTFASHWAVGINAGYRKRNPGQAIAGVPFRPMGDQWIYSIAGSYLIASIDTKLILELYGSRAAEGSQLDSNRGLNALEALAGIKHDFSQNFAMHVGMTRQVDASLGGPDWRVYGGINIAFGPLCGSDATAIEAVTAPEPIVVAKAGEVERKPEVKEQLFKIDDGLLFATNSDDPDRTQVEAIVAIIKNQTSGGFTKIVVEGHTDSVGPAEYNALLSQRRADAIKKILVEDAKIAAEKVESIGLGATQPIDDNGNYQGRRRNRRVALKIVP